jgi:hypothetical protein
MEEIIEVIQSAYTGDLLDELDLIKDKQDPQSKLLKNLIYAELENRKAM